MSHASMRTGAAAVALFATLAAAQPGPDQRLDGKLDPKTYRAVSLLVDSAKAANLPVEPLIDKALEGASKHAAGPMIIQAVRNVSVALTKARNAMGGTSTPEELKAGAAAIRGGVPPQELQRFRSTARPGFRLAAAIDVMTDLINRGVPSDTAANLMHGLVQIAATDEQLFRLKNQIETDIVNGAPAAAVASARAHGLTETILADLPPGSGGASGSALPSGRNQAGKAGTSLAPQAAGQAMGSRAAGEAPAGPPAPNVPPRGKPKQRRP
jgi:hypothetical protein